MPSTMSCVGTVIGWPEAGDRMLCERQHQHAGLDLGLGRERNVHRHLVAVEVGVEGGADQRVDLDGLAFHQHRLEGLDAQAVQRGSAVQQHRVVLDDLFQDVPDLGSCCSTISLACLMVVQCPVCSSR